MKLDRCIGRGIRLLPIHQGARLAMVLRVHTPADRAEQQRRLDCIEPVQAILKSRERDGGAVTVALVAAWAGVSRTFLYDNAQTALRPGSATFRKQPATGRPALAD
ncbi:hypothetical protein ABZX38_17835 [Streptomyces longwoodensis]|uniref:hypothetical protein n=1 Tax=Streptomyces longwoodensis TaxID=68231 RepID=UPI0033B213E8